MKQETVCSRFKFTLLIELHWR